MKITFRILVKKFDSFSKLKSKQTFSQFSKEFLCFTPFITISALSVFYYMAETNILGKINNFLHILGVYLTILIPCFALLKPFSKKKTEKSKPKHQNHKQKHKTKTQ